MARRDVAEKGTFAHHKIGEEMAGAATRMLTKIMVPAVLLIMGMIAIGGSAMVVDGVIHHDQ